MARTKPAPAPIAVTYSRAAALMDCSRQHVYNLVERGVLRSVHIPESRSVRIPIADVYAALGLEVPIEGVTSSA